MRRLFLATLFLIPFCAAHAQSTIGRVVPQISLQTLLAGQDSTFFTDSHGALWVDNYTGSVPTIPLYTKPAPLAPLAPSQMELQVTSSTATYLTPPAGALYAYITVEGEAVRWRDDGTAPTNSQGQPLATGSLLNYQGNLNTIEFIAQQGTAIIDVSYYK